MSDPEKTARRQTHEYLVTWIVMSETHPGEEATSVFNAYARLGWRIIDIEWYNTQAKVTFEREVERSGVLCR